MSGESAMSSRWSTREVCLGLGIPLLTLALSMDWFGHGGVGFGDVLSGADRAPVARVIGYFGYGACALAFSLFLESSAGGGTRRHRALAWATLFAVLAELLAGLGLAATTRSTELMRPGFPLFCCAVTCVLIGVLKSWPPERPARAVTLGLLAPDRDGGAHDRRA
ncbi:MAG: hypothetical protein R3A79_15450 [Nannocystaceae bacterium]